jgi:hypothetical protein
MGDLDIPKVRVSGLKEGQLRLKEKFPLPNNIIAESIELQSPRSRDEKHIEPVPQASTGEAESSFTVSTFNTQPFFFQKRNNQPSHPLAPLSKNPI